MNTPHHDPETPWETRLRQARADVGPGADISALLRAVRHEPLRATLSWVEELSAEFASPRFIPSCLSAAAACAVVATWQLWQAWELVPWAQLLASQTGGGS